MNANKAIFIDLTGVLFHLNKFRLLRFIGISDVLRYLLKYRKNPVLKTLEILDSIARQEDEFEPAITYKHYWQPACIKAWMSGEITSTHVAQELHQKIDDHYQNSRYEQAQLESRLAKNSLKALFSPAILLECFKPDTKIFASLYQLKKHHQCKLYLISNFDKETFELLSSRYHKLFAIFDKTFISADLKLLKPDPSIFTTILKSVKIAPKDAFFIDDQQENIDAAQALGIQSFLYTDRTVIHKLFI